MCVDESCSQIIYRSQNHAISASYFQSCSDGLKYCFHFSTISKKLENLRANQGKSSRLSVCSSSVQFFRAFPSLRLIASNYARNARIGYHSSPVLLENLQCRVIATELIQHGGELGEWLSFWTNKHYKRNNL